MRAITYAGGAVLLALVVAASGFAVGPGGGQQVSPVSFERTLSTGMTGVDVQQAESEGYAIPKGQVFYSQYQYVVGYYGLDALAAGVSGRQAEQFGEPLAAFVTDYAGTDPTLTDGGHVTLSNSAERSWTRTENAVFAVDTPARTPAGPTPVPFGDRDAALSFAAEYGGRVVDWTALQDRLADRQGTGQLTPPTAQRQRKADETVSRARAVRDRPVSVVVGEDAPTLSAAVAAAPPNTTVALPPGRYEGNLTVAKPITLRGAGAGTVVDAGGGNATALTVTAPRVGVTSLRIEGVGDTAIGNLDTEGDTEWDRRIDLIYADGPAGIRLLDADRSLVADVTVDTPANGVVALDSGGTVVRNVTVRGSDRWENGLMGVLAMHSRLVVEGSVFEGGRDAVYTHYADGTVIRDNRMRNLRYGYHEMYSSATTALNNTVCNANAGVILMTSPTGTVLAGNEVRNSTLGISAVGSASYVTDNVVVGNDYGISIGTARSVYRGNTVVRNEVGMRSSTLLPTNDVFGNDVVANGEPASIDIGTVNVWAVAGRGNYWGAVPGVDGDGDGVLERPYRPTSVVDGSARHSVGSFALARSPALDALRQFQRAAPGLRSATVVDPAPLAEPVHPERLAALNVTESP